MLSHAIFEIREVFERHRVLGRRLERILHT